MRRTFGAGEGTHDELIGAKGEYFRLDNSQFEQAAYDLDAETAEPDGAAAESTVRSTP
jgi:ATP-binding cassette subfamily B multidrug efflux pump